jgi:hypothetical protein
MMKNLLKLAGASLLTCLCLAVPASAQITNAVNFTTPFAFYAGNTKLPAGSYKISPAGFGETTLLIENTAGTHSAFIDYVPTQTATHAMTDVTFNKYGGVEFLNRVWVGGQQYGMQVEQTKYEKSLAAKATPQSHSVPAK